MSKYSSYYAITIFSNNNSRPRSRSRSSIFLISVVYSMLARRISQRSLYKISRSKSRTVTIYLDLDLEPEI